MVSDIYFDNWNAFHVPFDEVTPQQRRNAKAVNFDTAFQVASIITTTGFSTVDFDKWPAV